MKPIPFMRLHRRQLTRLGVGALALCAPTTFAADRHDYDHDHQAAAPATAPATGGKAGDEHRPPTAGAGPAERHEHGHGEQAHHDDEVKLTAEAIKRHGLRVEPLTRRQLKPTFVAPARCRSTRTPWPTSARR